ncbi:metalloprotease [Dichomitus squalens]|uniref:Metalloprotease n=2 Tax=Dichomitus squalens TaxID=114155 RepID=A0A4Q9P6U4_9APHY|nr:metalloprotease [Dichomitus squalens LYAD-421 SS1]EJF58984.1 metalloprotease [Dichomitus squalens LYAD-421 SS1]TBU24122.1 metalloprotease [Dichomitus squalens]TBU47816.1 metalloprotease [Dichomitus squalens]
MLRLAFLSLLTVIATVSGPSNVYAIDNFNITTTVKNTGDEVVRLLNHPRGPLSDLPTDSFTITNRHGLSPDFVGISAKYSPSAALASNDHHAFTVLAPGQSVEVHHDIWAAYDFSASGPGQYIVSMKDFNSLYYVADAKPRAVIGASGPPFHIINVGGDARPYKDRADAHDGGYCKDWQDRAIVTAISLAEKYVDHAVEVLEKSGPNSASYKRWFGPMLHSDRHASVVSHFATLARSDFSKYTYRCNARFCGNRPGVLGYITPNEFGTITLCDSVFNAEVGGYNSRASTIVHQALQIAKHGDTDGHTSGEVFAQHLARAYPYRATTNTENYEYFAVSAFGDGDGVGQSDASVMLTQVHFGKNILDL